MAAKNIAATQYASPATVGYVTATPPLTMTNNGDSLTIFSGAFSYPTDTLSLIVGVSASGTYSVTVNPGASWLATGVGANNVRLFLVNGSGLNLDITNNGTITVSPPSLSSFTPVIQEFRSLTSSGNITTGQLSFGSNISTQSINLTAGTFTGDMLLTGAALPATLTLSGTAQLVGSIVENAFSFSNHTIRLNGSGNITGSMSLTQTQLINPLVLEYNSTGRISGAVSGNNITTLNIGNNGSTVNYTVPANMTNMGGFIATNGVLTINNADFTGVNNTVATAAAGRITLTKSLSGSGTVSNAGIIDINVANGLNVTGTLTNSGTLNVNNTLSRANNSTNTGAIIIAGGITLTNQSGNFQQNSGSMSGTGNFTNNATYTYTAGTVSMSGIFTNSASGTFVVSGTLAALTNMNNAGSITISNGGVFNRPTTFTNTGNMTMNGTGNFVGAYTNTNTLTANGSGSISGILTNNATFNVNGTFTPANNSVNSGTGIININSGGVFTKPTTYTNTGVTNLNGTGNISGDYTGGVGSSMNIGPSVASSYSTSGNISGIVNLNVKNGSTFTLNNTLSGGTVTAEAGGTLVFATGATNSNPVVVNTSGIFNVTGSCNNTAAISNSGTMSVSNTLANSGTITNNAGGTLQLQNGANVAHAITNNNIMTVTGSVNLTNTVTNTGTISVSNALTMTGQNLNSSSGVVTLASTASIQTGTYTNANIHNTNISGVGNAGTLTATGAVNLAGATINVSATTQTVGSWVIVEAGPGLLTQAAQVNLPSDSILFTEWSYRYNPDTRLIIDVTVTPYEELAVGPINQAIASVLDDMRLLSSTNPGQQALLDAINSSVTEAEYNANVQELMPLMNVATPIINMQNSIFQKVETRLASLNQKFSEHMNGIATGDCSPSTAMWIGGFGSYGKQRANEENFGYTAKGFGSIVGFDTRLENDSMFGLAFALSKTIIHDDSNTNFVNNTIGYNALMYGVQSLSYDNSLEWLLTGAVTVNHGSRQINISNTVMSTGSTFTGGQVALRLNLVKRIDYMQYLYFSPVASLQYFALYQPDYTENYSPAALNISPSHLQNVLTAGAGARMSFPYDDWWLIGTRELRILGTYDLVTSNNIVTSNFVVGSNNFTLTNPHASRIALKAGVDVGFILHDKIQLVLSYDYELRSKYYDQSANLKLKILF